MKNTTLPQKKQSLLLKYQGLFDDPYEWCLLERIYFSCNTTPNRKWVCRQSYLLKHTPIKQNKTLTATLTRLNAKGFVDRVEYGKPFGKHLTQRYHYTADQNTIDKLICEMDKKQRPVNSPVETSQMTGSRPVNSLVETSQMTGYSQEESKLLIEKEDSKEIRDRNYIAFTFACKNLPKDKSGSLYESMFQSLCKEYGITGGLN